MAMVGMDGSVSIAENFRRFACLEAAGRSPTYEVLAMEVADDHDVLGLLMRLPPVKQQPNLLFAAARQILNDVPDIDALRTLATSRADELAAVMLHRRTQTNEPGRCATLLPALAMISGPLAMVEVGASAGLCLNLIQYSYHYGMQHLPGADPDAPTFRCSVLGGSPTLAMPHVTWVAGIDLDPLDPADPGDRSWLECLVWPDQPERAAYLAAALDTTVRHPVSVHPGDLIEQLPRVLERAPAGATPVVFHSAVLAYLDHDARKTFADLIRALDVIWVTNERESWWMPLRRNTTPHRSSSPSTASALHSPTPTAIGSTGPPDAGMRRGVRVQI